MNNLAKVLLYSVLITLFTLTTPFAVLAADALEGKTFATLLDGEDDVLTFQDGMFNSSSCEEWGYGPGKYTTTGSGDSLSFEATTTSEKHGGMVWTGTIQGDKIKGSYLWTKEGWFGTKTKTKNFEGTLKQ